MALRIQPVTLSLVQWGLHYFDNDLVEPYWYTKGDANAAPSEPFRLNAIGREFAQIFESLKIEISLHYFVFHCLVARRRPS